MIYYEDSVYQSASSISIFFLVLIILALIFFFAFAALRRAVIAVETLIIIELAYFCILGQSSVEIGLSALAFYGKFSYGINVNLLENGFISCEGIGELYQECNSIDNINITAYLAALCLFIAMGI